MSRARVIFVALWPVAAYCLGIFALSTIPGRHIPQIAIANFDKVEHFGLYGLFGVVLARPVARLRPGLRPGSVVLVVAYLALLYGITDEVHQLFTPGRSCDPFDAMADLSGGTAGALAYVYVLARLRWGRRPAKEAAP